MANAPVIFRFGSVVDDTKLTAGQIAVMLARATFGKDGPFSEIHDPKVMRQQQEFLNWTAAVQQFPLKTAFI